MVILFIQCLRLVGRLGGPVTKAAELAGKCFLPYGPILNSFLPY